MRNLRIKRAFFYSIFLFVFCLLSAQDNQSLNIFENVEIGSKNYYLIKTQDNKVHKARIVSVDSQNVLILMAGGQSMTIPTNRVVEVNRTSYNSPGSIGLGFGLPYGLLGANMDIRLVNVVYATAGIGTGIYVNPMYSVGLKCYLRSGNYKFRPRIMANYGTTAMIYVENSFGSAVESSTYRNFYVGTGFQWALNITKSIAFDLDLIYILDNGEWQKRMDELILQGYEFDIATSSNFKFSLGLRYIF